MARTSPTRRRGGFTLVELLVAVAIAILLTAIAAGLANSGAFGSQRVITSSDRVSGWLLNARQRALRDGQPRGVRFFVSAGLSGQNVVTSAQYIESPDPWSPPPADGAKIAFVYTTSGTTVNSRKVFFHAPSLTDFADFVSNGDTLFLPGMGSFRVNSTADASINVDGAAGNEAVKELTLESYPDLGLVTSTNGTTACLTVSTFAFFRQARPLFGEPLLGLPETGAIDAAVANTLVSGVAAGSSVDVLFAPNGRVLNQAGAFVALWVRDMSINATDPGNADFDKAGQQSLVIVYPKTGAIATQPVNQGTTPFSFATDGINTGL